MDRSKSTHRRCHVHIHSCIPSLKYVHTLTGPHKWTWLQVHSQMNMLTFMHILTESLINTGTQKDKLTVTLSHISRVSSLYTGVLTHMWMHRHLHSSTITHMNMLTDLLSCIDTLALTHTHTHSFIQTQLCTPGNMLRHSVAHPVTLHAQYVAHTFTRMHGNTHP